MYFVYMIKNKKNKLYVGISENPQKRLVAHNSKAGAFFTSSGDFRLVFVEAQSTINQARSREVQIKKWRREKKEILIDRYNKGLITNAQNSYLPL
jgi:putative endonuclease